MRGGVKSGDGWKEMTALRAAVPSYHTTRTQIQEGYPALSSQTHATSIQISIILSPLLDLHSDPLLFLGPYPPLTSAGLHAPSSPFLFLVP